MGAALFAEFLALKLFTILTAQIAAGVVIVVFALRALQANEGVL